eukprot:TRINITY_DN24260_c0_g1_i1.p1 TRINITY_DN24260_c0_g1~~TRINITY_DN24260_c0_g1_i1.p1  ORF type:complete len:223 (-),score=38.73 TRINITY_DN24260_c0_g1_i1:156-776(-)
MGGLCGKRKAEASNNGHQAPAMTAEDPSGLLPFFRGTGADIRGRRLADIRAYDFVHMERVHDYVQWIFPTDEMSMFNPHAPLLTPHLQRVFSEDPKLQEELRENLSRFCDFLGLKFSVAEGGSCEVIVADHFDQRLDDCWSAMMGTNHNWLRISRVLQCLGLCGMPAEQQAFYKCLATLPAAQGVKCQSALPHWLERAKTVPAFKK